MLELLIIAVIFAVIFLILGISMQTIFAIFLWAAEGLCGLILLMFLFSIICLLRSKKKTALFLGMSEDHERTRHARYLIDSTEYEALYPMDTLSFKIMEAKTDCTVFLCSLFGHPILFDSVSILTIALGSVTFSILFAFGIFLLRL